MRKKVGVTLMKLQESGENYLETILILEKRNGIARSVDVATELGFSKPSVSRAVSILKEGGYEYWPAPTDGQRQTGGTKHL